jgi:hypothetical protein
LPLTLVGHLKRSWTLVGGRGSPQVGWGIVWRMLAGVLSRSSPRSSRRPRSSGVMSWMSLVGSSGSRGGSALGVATSSPPVSLHHSHTEACARSLGRARIPSGASHRDLAGPGGAESE